MFGRDLSEAIIVKSESEPHPSTGQPVGLPVNVTPARRPGPVTLEGRYGRVATVLRFVPVETLPSSDGIAERTSCCTVSRMTVSKLLCLGIAPPFR